MLRSMEPQAEESTSGRDTESCAGSSSGERKGGRGRGFAQRYQKLTGALCEVVEDYALLRFVPMSIKVR